MRLYVNLDLRRLQTSLKDSRQLSQITHKRGDAELMEIYFVRDGVQQQLTSGSVVTYGVKESGKYDGDVLIFENGFILSGSGITAKYTASPSINTEPLNDALVIDADDSNDLDKLDLMGEITWTDGPAGEPTSTETFNVRVFNDVIRGDEFAPTSLPTPDEWLAERIDPLIGRLTLPTAGLTHILLYGQSNSSGSDALPVINSTSAYSHKTFSTGLRSSGGTLTGLLEESVSGQGETPASGIALSWSEIAPPNTAESLFLSTSGIGGANIDALESGSSNYTNMLAQVTSARTVSLAASQTYIIPAMVWIQGETDASESKSQGDYYDQMVALRVDMEAAFQTLTGDDTTLQVFVIQPSAYIRTSRGTAMAQLDACANLPTFHFLLPAFSLPHVNTIHYSAAGGQLAGRHAGRALRHIRDHETAPPALIPTGVCAKGREVIWSFNVPQSPILLNGPGLPGTINNGVTLTDDDGDVPILSMEGRDSDIRIVVSRDFEGIPELRYGIDFNGTSIVNGASGSISDSTADSVWIDGTEYPMPHPAPHYVQTVTVLRADSGRTVAAASIPVETGAYGHWIFGTSSASLTGSNAKVLTPTSGITPTYSSNSVTLPNDSGVNNLQGLASDLDDRASFTLLMVVKRPAAVPGGDYIHFGGTASVGGSNGVGILSSSAATVSFSRYGTGSYSPNFADALNGGDVGDWLFLAFRESATSFGYIPSSDAAAGRAITVSARTPVGSRKIGIGNCHDNYSNCRPYNLEFAEMILFDSTLTAGEIYAVMTRSRQRMAQRGIYF